MTDRVILVAAACAILCLASSCSNGASGRPDELLASAVIGPSGGMLEITEGDFEGVRIDVPMDAVEDDTTFSIYQPQAIAVPGYIVAGRTVRLGPAGVDFLKPITVTLPFSPPTNEAVILQRSGGEVVEVRPSTVPASERLAAPVLKFSQFWPAERAFNGFDATSFWPLFDGNTWEFDNSTTITMEFTNTEPNIASFVYKTTFQTPTRELGVYLQSSPFGLPESVGTFADAGGLSFQELHDAVPLPPSAVTLRQTYRTYSTVTGYEPFGRTTATYTGFAEIDVFPERPSQVTVPIGVYDELLKLRMFVRTRRDDGSETEIPIVVTLAKNVGPVQVEFLGVSAGLVSGMLFGIPISPPT